MRLRDSYPPLRHRDAGFVITAVGVVIGVAVLFMVLDFVDAVSVLAVIVAPLSIGCAVFLWWVYVADLRTDPKRGWVRLSAIMATSSTIAAIVSSYIAVVVILRLSGFADLARQLTPFTVLAFLALDVIPLMNAGYLLWLRRHWTPGRPRRQDER